MSLFRTPGSAVPKPSSPVSLFRDLKRSQDVKFLWAHQQNSLEVYHQHQLNSADVALELPTGSGKTLVGLLVAEFRRRALDQRVVVLCPTKQLCAQVARQAKKYGVPCSLLVGKQSEYDDNDFLKYQRAQAVGVTTYSGVFNNNPRIKDPQTIICDDAHSGEGFIAEMWSLRIERAEHKDLFIALFRLLKQTMSEGHAHLIEESYDDPRRLSVDMLSPIAWAAFAPKISETIGALLPAKSAQRYVWSNLSQNLLACSVYCTPQAFEFRPSSPPTFMHQPFTNASQRLYMSATLGEDGDLERSFGRKRINKIPITEGWTTGRRLVLFPELSDLGDENFLVDVINVAGKSLILMPSFKSRDAQAAKLNSKVAVLLSADSEHDIQIFRDHPEPVALVLANRYDGIDFPGEECRCEMIYDLPKGSSLQELFFTQRLRATSILRDRFRTRVTQAMGRCTRDESDYSVVLAFGEDLRHWFCTQENVAAMHPALQAEVAFGLDNSTERTAADFLDLIRAFLDQADDWEHAEESIRKLRDESEKNTDPSAPKLQESAQHEVEFGNHLWSGRYHSAMSSADEVLRILSGGQEIRPYRCFWEHQAAVASYLRWTTSHEDKYKNECIERLKRASIASHGLSWLSRLASALEGQAPPPVDRLPYVEWFSVVNGFLSEYGLVGSKFSKALAAQRANISCEDAKKFHQGLEFLGRMLGADSRQWPTSETGKPDGFWSFGYWRAFVFEAKTEEKGTESISLRTVRQAATHETTARSDKFLPPTTSCTTVIVSARTTLRKDAEPHSGKLMCVTSDALLALFDRASEALTQIRIAAQHEDSEKLPESALQIFKAHGAFIPEVVSVLEGTKVKGLPIRG